MSTQVATRIPRVERQRLNNLRRDATKSVTGARREWSMWKAPWKYGMHIDYCLAACADKCGWCEGCISVDIRACKREEVTASGEMLKSVIVSVDAKLDGTQPPAGTPEAVLLTQDYRPYNVHPFLASFPLLDFAEFAALVDDIAEHGLAHSIMLTYDKSTIVDGRLRYLACRAALVDPHFQNLPESFTDRQIVDYIMSENFYRCHPEPDALYSHSASTP